MSAHLTAHAVHFAHADHEVLRDVSLTVSPDDRIGVLGPNGVGKSTLLSLLAGTRHPDAGDVRRSPTSATVVLIPQELDTRPGDDVADVAFRRAGLTALQEEFDAATAGLADGGREAAERYDLALERWLAGGAADADARLDDVLDRVGLGADRRGQPVDSLSGGQRARVALAGLLLTTADVLLLDEPTNDLDHEGLARLDEWVDERRSALVIVSHDRAFLRRTVNAVFELDDHTRTGTRFNGGWDAYLEARETAARHAQDAFDDYSAERDRLAARARQQSDWASKGVARAKRSDEPDKNIRSMIKESTEQQASKAKQTRRALDRLQEVDKPWVPWELRLELAEAPRSGQDVVSARGLTVQRGGFRLGPIDLDIRAGERVHLTGANGSGKTTLLRLLLGDLAPDDGVARLGTSVQLSRLDQARATLASTEPLLAVAEAATGATTEEVRTTFAKLGLDQRDVVRPATNLSPGERTRALLGVFMLRPANTLVLDEPTNHLDLPAIEQLGRALGDFGGTVIVVSHDRTFVDELSLSREIALVDGRLVADRPLT